MNIADQQAARRIADAATIPPDVVAKLPRIGEPKKTFIAVDARRMARGRGHTAILDAEGLTYYRDVYEDCPHCRRYRQGFSSSDGRLTLPRRDELIRSLERNREVENYWCNNCQGTGWHIESWEAVTQRLGLVTWADFVALLTDERLQEIINRGPAPGTPHFTSEGFPMRTLTAELIKRFQKVAEPA